MLTAFRNSWSTGSWLTPDRLRVYPRLLVCLYAVIGMLWVGLSTDWIDAKGKPLGYDFITFWSAADVALAGAPADAYDRTRLFVAQRKAVPALPEDAVFLWHYPPTFQLAVLPLALLPYLWSLALFIALTLALYVIAVSRLIELPPAAQSAKWWLLLASPGVFVNIFHGQNAFLTAALVGGGLLWLDRRPNLAGILLGLLSYKPHFGALIPFALLAGGYYRAFAVAAVTAVGFALVATAALGTETWVAFIDNLATTRLVLEQGLLPWHKMHSVFAMSRLLGAGIPLAYAMHAAVALSVAWLTIRVWRRADDLALRAALLIVATMIVSPYFFDYDLAVLALPIGLLAADGLRRGWSPGLISTLALAWGAPLFAVVLADHLRLQVTPVVLLALFAMTCRRLTNPGVARAPLSAAA